MNLEHKKGVKCGGRTMQQMERIKTQFAVGGRFSQNIESGRRYIDKRLRTSSTQ